MREKTDLREYLPQFMRGYKELASLLDAEAAELDPAWEGAERTLNNEFIGTADEYGLERFERLLGITPAADDTAESRRARIYSRWFTELPYTLKMFIRKLSSLAGGDSFEVLPDPDNYRVGINTRFELCGQTDELIRLVDQMFPCNIAAVISNTVRPASGAELFCGGAVIVTEQAAVSSGN